MAGPVGKANFTSIDLYFVHLSEHRNVSLVKKKCGKKLFIFIVENYFSENDLNCFAKGF